MTTKIELKPLDDGRSVIKSMVSVLNGRVFTGGIGLIAGQVR